MYVIRLNPGRHKLVFSFIGYNSETLDIFIEDQDVERNIYLKPTLTPVSEIVVSHYHPAERIILKAISKKKEIMIARCRQVIFYLPIMYLLWGKYLTSMKDYIRLGKNLIVNPTA